MFDITYWGLNIRSLLLCLSQLSMCHGYCRYTGCVAGCDGILTTELDIKAPRQPGQATQSNTGKQRKT